MKVNYKEILEVLKECKYFLEKMLNDKYVNTDEKLSYARTLDKIDDFLRSR